MNRNNTIKVKSITDVITNSSTEVFTIYNDGGIKTILTHINGNSLEFPFFICIFALVIK